ncbi:MAG: HtaA domain-containing protein [Solirubrobacterales bacterium]|nr:HtaA domain-containing protein [Solirubrobacterales bacterium]
MIKAVLPGHTSLSPLGRLTLGVSLVIVSFILSATLVNPAAASSPVSGKAVFTLGSGKAGKALKAQRVAVAPLGAGTLKRLAGKRVRIGLRPTGIRMSPARVDLAGGILFRRGKRKAPFRKLRVVAHGRTTLISGESSGKRVGLFRSAKRLTVDRAWRDLKWHAVARLNRSVLTLTPAAARMVGKRLKLKRLGSAPVGTVALSADRLDEPVTPPPVDLGDPYFVQCGIQANAIGAGDFPPAAALPSLTGDAVQPGSPNFNWGLKEGLRSYLKMFAGSMHALDGATLVNDDGSGNLKPVNFSFPVTGGTYDRNQGKAVVNMSGTGLFCNKAHGFRVAFTNPTVVIDGQNSRIDADVDYNKFGTWFKTQRTAIATLDTSGVPADESTPGEVTWSGIPAKFTDAGAWPFCAEGGPPGTPDVCIYKGPSDPNGATSIDPVSITIKVPEDG